MREEKGGEGKKLEGRRYAVWRGKEVVEREGGAQNGERRRKARERGVRREKEVKSICHKERG